MCVCVCVCVLGVCVWGGGGGEAPVREGGAVCLERSLTPRRVGGGGGGGEWGCSPVCFDRLL